MNGPEAVRTGASVQAGGAATESMGGLAVVVLSILSLLGVLGHALTPIAGIVFGAALLIEAAALAAQRNAFMGIANAGGAQMEFGAGVSAGVVAGVAAVALGVLALVGVAAATLMAALVITGGLGLIIGAGAVHELNEIAAEMNSWSDASRRISRSAVRGAVGAQVLAGLAAMVLGVLALIPAVGANLVLTTVGLLVLGAAEILSGSALSGRVLGFIHRRRI